MPIWVYLLLVEGKAEPEIVRCRHQADEKGGLVTFYCVDRPCFQVRADRTLYDEIEYRPDDR